MVFHLLCVRSGLSPLEVARMRVAYGLVKEHADALRTEKTAIDPETNPLIDPRSVRDIFGFIQCETKPPEGFEF